VALNSVAVVGPRSEASDPKEPKKDPLEQVLQGLNIANTAFGIAANYQTIQNKRLENKMLTDERNGLITAKNSADLQAKGLERTAPGEVGSSTYKVRTGEGDNDFEQIGLRLPGKAKEITAVDTVDEKGNPVTKMVSKTEGLTLPKPKEKVKPDTFKDTEISKAAQAEGNRLVSETSGYRGAIEASAAAGTLTELAKTNPVAAAASTRQLARAAGDKGVLSDADTKAFGGSQAIMDQLARIAERAETGNMTPDDAKYANEVATVLGAKAQANLDKTVENSTHRFTKNFGGNFEDNYERLTGTKYVAKKEGASTPAANGKSSAPPPGSIIKKDGKSYKVGEDGDTLIPVGAK
jgi:hypothetical protein